MAQLQLPRVDANALRERVRDIDLSRLADLGDEVRKLDLAEMVKGLDVDTLRHLDLDSVRHLDLDGLRHLADGAGRPELDLDALRDSALVRRVQRALGREPKRNVWSSLSPPPLSATIVAGVAVMAAGAVLGGLLAWLYQPGKGERRRAAIRRRLGRIARKVRRTLRPA